MLVLASLIQIISVLVLLYPLSIQVKGLKKHWKTSRNGLRATRLGIFLITLVLIFTSGVNSYAVWLASSNKLLVSDTPFFNEFQLVIVGDAIAHLLASISFGWLYYVTRNYKA